MCMKTSTEKKPNEKHIVIILFNNKMLFCSGETFTWFNILSCMLLCLPRCVSSSLLFLFSFVAYIRHCLFVMFLFGEQLIDHCGCCNNNQPSVHIKVWLCRKLWLILWFSMSKPLYPWSNAVYHFFRICAIAFFHTWMILHCRLSGNPKVSHTNQLNVTQFRIRMCGLCRCFWHFRKSLSGRCETLACWSWHFDKQKSKKMS